MLSPLFFHSFRVDFQHSAWRIRHTNHSQLLMGIAQMVEELVQNKKNQLKPSKTWEKAAVNSGWICHSCSSSCQAANFQLAAPEVEMAKRCQKIRNGERTSTVSERNLLIWTNRAGGPWVIYTCWSSGWRVQGSPPGRKDISMFSCFPLAKRLEDYKWTGRKFKIHWSGLSGCSLEKQLWCLINICIFS